MRLSSAHITTTCCTCCNVTYLLTYLLCEAMTPAAVGFVLLAYSRNFNFWDDSQNWYIYNGISQNTLERSSPIFRISIHVYVSMINLTFVLLSLKGRCCGNQLILWRITNTDWYHVPHRLYWPYRMNWNIAVHANARVNSDDDPTTSCNQWGIQLNDMPYHLQ